MSSQKPTIGRIVHYTDRWGNERPAIITRVRVDGRVTLMVFDPPADGWHAPPLLLERQTDVSEGTGAGEWHWPEREEEHAPHRCEPPPLPTTGTVVHRQPAWECGQCGRVFSYLIPAYGLSWWAETRGPTKKKEADKE